MDENAITSSMVLKNPVISYKILIGTFNDSGTYTGKIIDGTATNIAEEIRQILGNICNKIYLHCIIPLTT